MKQIRSCSTWTRDSNDYLFIPQVNSETIQSHFVRYFLLIRVSDTPPIEFFKKKNLVELLNTKYADFNYSNWVAEFNLTVSENVAIHSVDFRSRKCSHKALKLLDFSSTVKMSK